MRPLALRVANSRIDGRLQQIDFRAHSLMQDVKKVGPNLKDVRLKLNKNWIPTLAEEAQRVPSGHQDAELPARPTRRSRRFRRTSGSRASPIRCPTRNPGTPITARNCLRRAAAWLATPLAKADDLQGGTFSANLTRVGEKANYDYLVRWIHNARERTRPYCPYERRKTSGPKTTPRRIFPTCLIWRTASARTTGMNSRSRT